MIQNASYPPLQIGLAQYVIIIDIKTLQYYQILRTVEEHSVMITRTLQ